MLVTYDQREDATWTKGRAWRHLLRENRPQLRLAGHLFAPHDCHFRKTHDYNPDTDTWIWQWYVWAFALPKGEVLEDEPSEHPPDFIRPWGKREVLERYCWRPRLILYDGVEECSAFVLSDDPLLLDVKRDGPVILGEGSNAFRKYST